jgi:hypothetical protein
MFSKVPKARRLLDKSDNEIQRITYEHSAPDPRTRVPTLIHGRDVSSDASAAIARRNRSRLGQAKSFYGESDAGGSHAVRAARTTPESAARLAGIPLIKIPDLGIVRDRYGDLQVASKGDLVKLRRGSEAQPFRDPREHVVYKVYSTNAEGGLGWRLSFVRHGKGVWSVGHEAIAQIVRTCHQPPRKDSAPKAVNLSSHSAWPEMKRAA